ncbi:UPF0394 membrane protein [Lasiodiplodia theobromae]|uniref:UPF0394 membrane protein n=1 Tax=Lasiodiplodia theobromae TaxID=45133 RepID=A0A5N5DBY4_9PEZI|nr:UPF0394 membrane protein [Lasiodiplodia theobromae]
MSLASEFGAGALFGSALAAAGIYSPALIKAQMQLADFTMLKTFISASASGALAIHLADRIGFAPIKPRTPQNLGFFVYDGNIIGGALLGAGMALTGACPGTSLVQLAAGLRSGLFVVLGGMAGGIVHVAVLPLLQKKRDPPSCSLNTDAASIQNQPAASDKLPQEPTLQSTFKLNTNTLLLSWEILCVLFVQLANVFTGVGGQGPGLVGPVTGGCLIGAAQAGTVWLTRHTVGVSSAYGNLAQSIFHFLGLKEEGPLLTPSVLFAAGILSSSAVVTRLASETALQAIRAGSADVAASTALLGGFAMVFGARLAGGCTSGHGISGLVTFSWASFISVAAMFGSGILTALITRL